VTPSSIIYVHIHGISVTPSSVIYVHIHGISVTPSSIIYVHIHGISVTPSGIIYVHIHGISVILSSLTSDSYGIVVSEFGHKSYIVLRGSVGIFVQDIHNSSNGK